MPAPTSTNLNVNLSSQLKTELAQIGVYAYAVYFDTQGNNPTWTTLVDNGTVASGGQVQIPLSIPYVGGKVYFLVQSSSNPTGFVPLNDATNGITTESEINWANATSQNFRYDSFEVTLQNDTGDAGNLTSVEGFGLPMDLSITYDDGTTSTRGYAVSGSATFTAIDNLAAGTIFTYASGEGPLAGNTRMGMSPTQSVGINPTSGPFKTSDWTSYVTSLQVADPNITIAGFFDGTKDANGVYHNPGYFAYELTWDGTYFWLQPDESSQIQGWIQITPGDLENSIYSTLGNVTIYNSANGAATTPYEIYLNGSDLMNSGANNQWGAILTQFLTGFTAGFYGTTGKSLNSEVTNTIDLNNTWNWDPIYSFGNNLSSSSAAPLFYDKYSEIFFFNSNSYGSGYSDNLMKQYAVGGPLISVYDPDLSGNVANINITIYADSETPAGYTTPVIYNYIAPTGSDYETPTVLNPNNNIQLNFSNGTMVLDQDVDITLEIYLGNGEWSTLTISSAAASGGTLWQQWDISQADTEQDYAIAPHTNPPSTLPTGIAQFNNFPVPENGIAWYRVTVGDKTFNLYTTTSTTSGSTEFVNQPGALAIDGLANIVTTTDGDATIPTFKVNFLSGVTSAINPDLLTWNTDSTVVGQLQQPNAIIAGTLGTGTASPTPGNTSFTAFSGQDNQVSNSITVTTTSEFAFGWTGLNSSVNTPSWISGYTNKTSATNVAKIDFVNHAGGQNPTHTTATADIDGQWLTPTTKQLGNGTYTVTMTEYLAGDTGFQHAAAPTSSALTLSVNVQTMDLGAGLGGQGIELEPGSSGVAGNWVNLKVQQSSLPTGTTLLVYAVNQSGQLIDQSGNVVAGLSDAVRATIGNVLSDAGVSLLTGEQSLYLRAGEILRFALLTEHQVVDIAPNVTIVEVGDGSININVAGMQLTAHTDNDLSDAAVLAASQRDDNQPWIYLQHGAMLEAEIVGSSAHTNTLGFVRIDVDPVTGEWSVGGVDYGNTNAFRAAVRAEMDDGFLVHRGGNFTTTVTWTVAGASGFYAPVLLSQLGDTFVIGDANRDGNSYVRMFGENTFGLEDLAADQGSDFDYNDMVVRLNVIDIL